MRTIKYETLAFDGDLRIPSELLVLGLGSNEAGTWGDRRATLHRALSEVAEVFGPLAVAPIYRTIALARGGVPRPDQPEYLNTVVLTRLPETTPLETLRKTQKIEAKAGRAPLSTREIDAPRALDVDILLWGTTTIQQESLQVPHPRMRERRFVLRPLVDLVPRITLPPDGASAAEILFRLGSSQTLQPYDTGS